MEKNVEERVLIMRTDGHIAVSYFRQLSKLALREYAGRNQRTLFIRLVDSQVVR